MTKTRILILMFYLTISYQSASGFEPVGGYIQSERLTLENCGGWAIHYNFKAIIFFFKSSATPDSVKFKSLGPIKYGHKIASEDICNNIVKCTYESNFTYPGCALYTVNVSIDSLTFLRSTNSDSRTIFNLEEVIYLGMFIKANVAFLNNNLVIGYSHPLTFNIFSYEENNDSIVFSFNSKYTTVPNDIAINPTTGDISVKSLKDTGFVTLIVSIKEINRISGIKLYERFCNVTIHNRPQNGYFLNDQVFKQDSNGINYFKVQPNDSISYDVKFIANSIDSFKIKYISAYPFIASPVKSTSVQIGDTININTKFQINGSMYAGLPFSYIMDVTYWTQGLCYDNYNSFYIAKKSDGTSINELFKLNEAFLFPNPTDGKLKISNGMNLDSELNIYDEIGREIFYSKSSDEIDISFLKPGLYLVWLTNQNSAQRQRIIKL